MGIEQLTLVQDLELFEMCLNHNKLQAIKWIKDNVEDISLKESKQYCDDLTEKLNGMGLKQAKLVGDVIVNGNDIAKEIVGFSVREIEEPAGYMAVMYYSKIPQLAALYAINNNLIIQKREEALYVGHYYRFKKDVDIECKEILKL